MNSESKKCTKCKAIKPLSAFKFLYTKKHSCGCRDCINEWRRKNRTRKDVKSKESAYSSARWRQIKIDPLRIARARKIEWLSKTKLRASRQREQIEILKIALSNPEFVSELCTCSKESALEIKIKNKKREAAWRKKNQPKAIARRRQRMMESPELRIVFLLRSRVVNAVRRAKSSKLVSTFCGCTIPMLKDHIESQFLEGMSWDNLGKGEGKWVIDHIKPIAAFDLSIKEQQWEAFHFSNLRPLWDSDNGKKNSIWNGKRWYHSDHKKETV